MSKRSNGFRSLVKSATGQSGVPTEGDRIAALAQAKMERQGLIASQTQATPAAPAPETPAPTAPATLTPEAVQQMVQAGVEAANQALEARYQADYASRQAAIEASQQETVSAIRQQLADAQAALATAQAAATQAEAQRTALVQQFGLDRFQGNPEPNNQGSNFGVPTLIRSEKPSGAAATLSGLIDQAPAVKKLNSRVNHNIIVRETQEIDRYVRQNRREVIRSMEDWGRNLGLFGGGRVTQAQTIIGDISGGFLPALSAIMRTNNRPSFIFHQFADTRLDFSKNEGDAIKIARAAFLPRVTDPNDRLLSGGGTYTAINSNTQALKTGTVNATIEEWGLGKDANSPPIGIPNFLAAFSMIDLMFVLDTNLMQDYYNWLDLKIRSMWKPTSAVVYNKKGGIEVLPTALVAGDDGGVTEEFLYTLFGYMRAKFIPSYKDGCYGLALNSLSCAQFKKSLSSDFNPATPEELAALTNIINPALDGEADQVSGYIGKYCNFHIFETNSFGCEAPGTEGVQLESIAGSPRITRSNYAFGSNTIGYGVASPVEIRQDTNTDFERSGRYIWTEDSGFAAMDVDPVGYGDSSAVPQQLRVLEFRALDQQL